MLTDKQQYRRLRTQAKARVVWGDPPEEVTEFLINAGVEPGEAETLVKRCVKKRNGEVRSRGLQKLFTGIGLVLVCAIFFGVLPWKDWVRSLDQMVDGSILRRRRSSLGTFLAVGVITAGVVGLWCIYRGICALLVPQKEELTDLE